MKRAEFFERTFKIEKELNLFEKKINGVFFWKLIRFSVCIEIMSRMDFFDYQPSNIKSSYFTKLKKVLQALNYSRHSTFLYKKKRDVLIFEHPRKVKDRGKYCDIYTKQLVESLQKDNVNFETIDFGFQGMHYEEPSKIKTYADDIYYDIVYKTTHRPNSIQFTQEEYVLVNHFSKVLFENFGVNVSDLTDTIKIALSNFNYEYKKYKKLFKIKKPKKIFIIVAYGHEGLISAAQDLGIKVIELQHGIIYNSHPGYSFEYSKKVPLPFQMKFIYLVNIGRISLHYPYPKKI